MQTALQGTQNDVIDTNCKVRYSPIGEWGKRNALLFKEEIFTEKELWLITYSHRVQQLRDIRCEDQNQFNVL